MSVQPRHTMGDGSIKLHPARLLQLKAIAEAHGIRPVQMVEEWINAEIAKGTVPDALPGFDVRRVGAHVAFGFEGLNVEITPPNAKALADAIENVALGKITAVLDLDAIPGGYVKLERKGRGLVIEAEDRRAGMSARTSIGFRMGPDLARQLRNAADQAEA